MFVFVFNTIYVSDRIFCIRVEVCGKYDCQHIQLPDCTRLITRLLGGYRITDDLILCTVFGGICIGAAIGLVIRMGASTGGMDDSAADLK